MNKLPITASILTIGDEICIGQVTNTNAAYLGAELTKCGLHIRGHFSIGDKADEISELVKSALSKDDIVIITGGLGPTHDDITKDVLCSIFDCKLVEDTDTARRLREFLTTRGRLYTERQHGQAMIPSNAIALPNDWGTAPGLLFNLSEKLLFALPGVPSEMKALFQNQVKPKIIQFIESKKDRHLFAHHNILVAGIAEADLADQMGDIKSLIKDDSTLAFLPSTSVIKLRISSRGNSIQAAEARSTEIGTEIHKRLKSNSNFNSALNNYKSIVLNDYTPLRSPENIEEILHAILLESNLTISVAESCTGGGLGFRFTSMPGSSHYFLGGVQAYQNEVKMNLLNVNRETLEKYGAVSKECAIEMAFGIRLSLQSDLAISITGIAGPDGGTEEKPVGTTWIGLSTKEKSFAKHFRFSSDREQNRDRSIGAALSMLCLELVSKTGK